MLALQQACTFATFGDPAFVLLLLTSKVVFSSRAFSIISALSRGAFVTATLFTRAAVCEYAVIGAALICVPHQFLCHAIRLTSARRSCHWGASFSKMAGSSERGDYLRSPCALIHDMNRPRPFKGLILEPGKGDVKDFGHVITTQLKHILFVLTGNIASSANASLTHSNRSLASDTGHHMATLACM